MTIRPLLPQQPVTASGEPGSLELMEIIQSIARESAALATQVAANTSAISGLTAPEIVRPWQYVINGSDFSTSGTSPASVTGFKFTPAASKTYQIEGLFILQTANTAQGPAPGWIWPSGLSSGSGWTFTPNSAVASSQKWSTFSAGEEACNSAGLQTANNSYASPFQALMIVGAAPSGDFQIRLRSEGAATVKMMAGSYLRYRELQ